MASLKKLVVKRPVQPVSGIPANPPKREEKRKDSVAPKSPSTPKSPVKERKSIATESTGKRPVSFALEPDSFQKSGGLQQSLSEPSLQTVLVDYGSHSYFYILSSQRFREAEVCRPEVYPIIKIWFYQMS